MPAGAWVHRGNKEEITGKLTGLITACDPDRSVFKRLPEHFENRLLEFGQLIQKKNTSVGKRHFSGDRRITASDQGGSCRCVMYVPEGTLQHKRMVIVEQALDAVYF